MTTMEHIAAAEKVRRKRQQSEAEYWRNYWAQKLAEAKNGQGQAPTQAPGKA